MTLEQISPEVEESPSRRQTVIGLVECAGGAALYGAGVGLVPSMHILGDILTVGGFVPFVLGVTNLVHASWR